MNYYHRYPGHYIAKTLHLSMEEDGAYTRLLDWMYLNERPVPHAERYAIARAMKPSERKAVDKILASYFTKEEASRSDGESGGFAYFNNRVDSEIAKNQPKIQAARENGRKGGRPRRTEPQEKPIGFENENPVGSPEKPTAKAPQTPNPITTPESLSEGTRYARTPAREAPPSDTVGAFEGHADPQPAAPNPVAPLAIALNRAGFNCTALNPDLIAYHGEGGTADHLAQVAAHPDCRGKPATYVVRFARRELTQPAATIPAGNAHDRPGPVTSVIANLHAKYGTTHFDLSGFSDDDPEAVPA